MHLHAWSQCPLNKTEVMKKVTASRSVTCPRPHNLLLPYRFHLFLVRGHSLAANDMEETFFMDSWEGTSSTPPHIGSCQEEVCLPGGNQPGAWGTGWPSWCTCAVYLDQLTSATKLSQALSWASSCCCSLSKNILSARQKKKENWRNYGGR